MTTKEISRPADVKRVVPRRNSREQLAHLLAEAAELEHNLLCCYLYAAFSLKQDGQDGLQGAAAAAVGQWRKSIIATAVEEMTHLALIANLAVSIGVRPHFNRPNLPVAPLYHPADIVVELAPFNLDTLKHFIYLERPEDSELADGESFARHGGSYTRGQRPGASLMPGAIDYETIGEFYAYLKSCLVGLASDLGEKALFCGAPDVQVGPDMVDLPGLATVSNLQQALAVLETIVTQGEGGAGSDQSHFSRFLKIHDEFISLQAGDASFQPAWPAARNPLMRKPADPASGVHVSEPVAAAALDLGNALYAIVLRLLAQAWGGIQDAHKQRKAALNAAMQLMGLMGSVGSYLCTLPASGSDAVVHAGLTFAVPRATEPLLTGSEAIWINERMEELIAGAIVVSDKKPALASLVPRLQAIAAEFRSQAAG